MSRTRRSAPLLALLGACGVAHAAVTKANTATVQLVAGDRAGGFADGSGGAAKLNAPGGLALDGAGNLLIADTANHRIRRMTWWGDVRTLAGSGEGNAEDADSGAGATFNAPAGLDVGLDGDVYVADAQSGSVRRVASNGGATATMRPRAGFARPKDVAIDAGGGIYVAEADAGWVRKLTGTDRPEVVTRGLAEPWGVAAGADGSLYVTDYGKQRIRRVLPSRRHYTFAGTGAYGVRDGLPGYATFGRPAAVTVDRDGYVYVADVATHRIRIISPLGVVATLAGGNEGFDDGAAAFARFDGPRGIAVTPDGATVYVADWHNNAIRRITGFDRARVTAPRPVGTTRDGALARGIPVTCFGNDPGRCVLRVHFNGRLIATRRVRLDYIGRRTIYVRLPADARAAVRARVRTDFTVTGTFVGPVGPRPMPAVTVAAR